jgi:hypothetical protein
MAKAKAVIAELEQETGVKGKLTAMEMDLASFTSVQNFVVDYKRSGRPLHVLVNNGILLYIC